MAVRPLRVAELAEVFAVDFDDAEGIPRLNADWPWEDQEQALLIACSSLIAIVEPNYDYSVVGSGDSRVVQFSHFSVKEFLTSSRIATASGDVSPYRIDLKLAHTILAQACLGVLLQRRDAVDAVDGKIPRDHALAQYAARHWTTHAQFGEISPRLQEGMEYLFDPDKPHFADWISLFDIDTKVPEGSTFYLSKKFEKSAGRPVYYAALCRFRDLVQHLAIEYPRDVNDDGGYYGRPLVAALAREHFKTADLLHHYGADSHVQGGAKMYTPLHSAAYYGNLEVVKKLIEYDVDIGAENRNGWTPLSVASEGRYINRAVIRLLAEHGADVNTRAKNGLTPLHRAALCVAPDVVRLLLELGADVEATDDDGKTAIHLVGTATNPVDPGGFDKIKKLLLEYRANVRFSRV